MPILNSYSEDQMLELFLMLDARFESNQEASIRKHLKIEIF